MRILVCCLFVCFSIHTAAQHNLSGSLTGSVNKYIYKINPEEALKLFKSDLNKVGEKYLHTLVDSLPAYSDKLPVLSTGNYLIIYAKENKLHYELQTIGDLNYKLVNNNRDLVIVLHNRHGQLIKEASVYIDKKKIPFDPLTHTYRLNKRKRSGFVQVLDNNVVYFFSIEKQKNYRYNVYQSFGQRIKRSFPFKYFFNTYSHYNSRRNSEYFYNNTASEKKFRGFIVFNKPMYKPGDSVKLKAYVMNRHGKALEKPLLLRLTDKNFTVDTIIAEVKPYRDGGYNYEFVLSDSLDLDLDDDYLITLEETPRKKYDPVQHDGSMDEDENALKRQVVIRGKFRYEEYELKSISFSARSDKENHSRGNPVSLFLKATDENEMAVMDGRVQILVSSLSYSAKAFLKPAVFLPDTLYYHDFPLEAIGETKITIPDSIFPAATFSYEIKCNFLNTNNETRSETLFQSFTGEKYTLAIEQRKDSLQIDHLVNGDAQPANALVYAFNKLNDTIEVKQVQLPASFAIHPFVHTYIIKTDSCKKAVEVQHTQGMVSASAFRTNDSISIQLINPYRLKVWYTLFAGKKILYRGYVDSLLFIDKVRTKKNYFVSLQYVYNDKIYHEDYTVPFQDKLLSIRVTQPDAVYPGQTATINLSVTDATGKDVQGADVTAYAFTKKFTNPVVPNIPYMGKRYPGRNTNSKIFTATENDFNKTFQLNWERWSKEMNLDTIEYYKFLHPHAIYKNTEATKDSITQIAPFVVIKGDVQPVHLIYVDEKPVFFSQSQNLKRYSFKISPGIHTIRMRTQNKSITMDSVFISNGMKTFISVNGDTTTGTIHVQAMPDTLTSYEKMLWSKYMILIENNFGENFTYIKQGDFQYLLNNKTQLSNHSGNTQLIGPLFNTYADFIVKNKFNQPFEVEGAYQYVISKGLIKQKQLRNPYPFNKYLTARTPQYNFRDFILTEKEIDSLWRDYLDHRSAYDDLFHNPALSKPGNGQLMVAVGQNGSPQKIFVKNILLFKYDEPDFLRVYKGSSRDLGYIKPGIYRLFLLLKDDDYFIMDSIKILKNGINYFETGIISAKRKDNTSTAMASIIDNREQYERRMDTEDLNKLKLTFNERYLDTSTFGYVTTGQVRDDKGHPLPFAIVMVKGIKLGTTSDDQGNFRIARPRNAVLIVSSIGYESNEVVAKDEEFQIIILKPAKLALEEVVVVGYGTQQKRSLTGSVSYFNSIDNVLSGKAAGLSIRGVASENAAPAPLIIMNGLPYSGSLADIDPALIGSITTMDKSAATAIYGSLGANGAIVITTKTNTALPDNPAISVANSLRRNFHDDAYWQPKLVTDEHGKASFNVTFPDDITNWRTYVIAMGSNKRTGFTQGSIKSFKALSSNLSLPQFLVAGDSANVIGKVLNYLSDSIAVKRTFSLNDSLVLDNIISLRNSQIDTFSVVAPLKDSLKFKYTIQKTDGYFDGEERSIPLFNQGSLETKGFFAALENDTSFTLRLDPALGIIKLYAEASLLPVLLEEIESIRNYKYLCNEQLASKLKALLLQKKVYAYLNRDFKADKNIVEIISKIDQSKSRNLWGWWNNNDPSLWISLHVVEALVMAEQNGYKINLNKQVITDYLVYNMESYKSAEKLMALEILQTLKAKVDFKRYVDTLEKNYSFKSLYEKLFLLNIRQKAGLPVLLDELVAKGNNTMFGNLYWGEDSYHFFDNSIQNTILMYRLLKYSGGYNPLLSKIRNYFLEKRKDGKWRNTYESSLILETILPDLLVNETAGKPSSLNISGSQQTQVTSFPFSMQVNEGEQLTVLKKGNLPVYFTAYQQRWNTAPEKVTGDFEVQVLFKKNDQLVTSLKAGEPVELHVEVNVKKDADFVMLEVPIPAGCSYQNKIQLYTNNEVHREYFKNKTSIFCRELKKGNYTFVISLLPRYTGTFHLNPAKAEMMYFPVFYGRDTIKKINIH